MRDCSCKRKLNLPLSHASLSVRRNLCAVAQTQVPGAWALSSSNVLPKDVTPVSTPGFQPENGILGAQTCVWRTVHKFAARSARGSCSVVGRPTSGPLVVDRGHIGDNICDRPWPRADLCAVSSDTSSGSRCWQSSFRAVRPSGNGIGGRGYDRRFSEAIASPSRTCVP